MIVAKVRKDGKLAKITLVEDDVHIIADIWADQIVEAATGRDLLAEPKMLKVARFYQATPIARRALGLLEQGKSLKEAMQILEEEKAKQS